MARNQLNIRVSDELLEHIDEKRIALAKEQGAIPTRSDIARYALGEYLDIPVERTDNDRRKRTVSSTENAGKRKPEIDAKNP